MTFSAHSFLLLDDISITRPDAESALLFQNPKDIITTTSWADLASCFSRMEQALDAGHYLAGFFSYELGYAFEDRLQSLAPSPDSHPVPLLWVAVTDAPERLTASEITNRLDPIRHHPRPLGLSPLDPGISRDAYLAATETIRDYLHAGDIYQVNYTFPLSFKLTGRPEDLYRRLRRSQPVPYGAWLHSPERDIISLSPELFLEKRGHSLTARPMKGTSPRGRTWAEDRRLAETLAADPKQRAENVMIVDLLRNDLSRIAAPGSVKVPDLFTVERYRTLLQMTSTVTARLDGPVPLDVLFQSLFPCGSITGAPKIRAMEIIRELEPTPRGVYTGAIGYITPERDFCLNVPIRTITLTPETPTSYKGSLGLGSGIVADSVGAGEYDECLLKGRFMTQALPEFDLLETLAWSEDAGYLRLDKHLDRLAQSAEFYNFTFDRVALTQALADFAEETRGPTRVRILLSVTGAYVIAAAPLGDAPTHGSISLSTLSVSSTNPLLYHKTTARNFYSAALKEARRTHPVLDVILQNERGELTEGSYTNLFIERNGQLLTPPLHSGLLPGILRAELIAQGKATEAVLYPDDLHTADQIWIGNSLRGLIPVTFTAE